jgi:hypothetical protein
LQRYKGLHAEAVGRHGGNNEGRGSIRAGEMTMKTFDPFYVAGWLAAHGLASEAAMVGRAGLENPNGMVIITSPNGEGPGLDLLAVRRKEPSDVRWHGGDLLQDCPLIVRLY